MKGKILKSSGAALATIGLLLAAGCSGGGSSTSSSSGTAEALTVAEKVSVVDAQSSGTSGSKVAALWAALSLPSDSDYNSDQTFVYVHDRTTDSFDLVNEILCMVSQAQYDAMLNLGDYKALINTDLCRGNDSASNAGQSQQGDSSSSSAVEYETWIVNSSRADSSSPHIVKVWIHQKADEFEPEMVIKAKMSITESSSSSNPYGLFTMNYAAYPATNGVQSSTTPVFKGTLKTERDAATGKVLLKLRDVEANGMFEEAATLEKNSNGTGGGTAYVMENFGSLKEANINFAYNSSLFHRQNSDGTGEACLDRTDFETSAWRYGLYNSTTGSRINLNSGFPIKYTSGGTSVHGWVGYWGLWLPNDVTIPNGATVYKQTYSASGGSETPYTVVSVGGKLKKHTKHATTLAGIKNIPLEGYMEGSTMYRVIWDGSQLVKTASASMSTSGPPAWTEISPPVAIDTTRLQFGEIYFWSQGLGGQVRVQLANCSYSSGYTSCDAPGGTTPVVYFTEDIIYPGDTVPSTLACYDNCPKAGASGINPNDLTYANSYDPSVDNRHNYTFSDMILMDGANQALLATAPSSQSWGFNSGPLFEPTSANLALLACDWNPSQTCGWKAWGAFDVFYTWETGPNNWNQLSALRDPTTSQPLRFDPPMRVEYIHAQTNSSKPDYKYNGIKFYLDYNGFGELHGIPGKCVNMNTGLTVFDCSGENIRWVPEFSIPADSSVAYNSSTSYYVKPLEVEQRMVKLSESACSAITISPYTLMAITEWVDPAIGTEPSVTGAPAVIGGVVQ